MTLAGCNKVGSEGEKFSDFTSLSLTSLSPKTATVMSSDEDIMMRGMRKAGCIYVAPYNRQGIDGKKDKVAPRSQESGKL